jgi:elongation factor Ts
MAITMEQIKELRAQTGAGVVDVKEALAASEGDNAKAISWLREKGKASAAKKADRATNEGAIGVYIHSNNKIGAMVTLLCETDFVARTDKFQELAKNLAMHVAAADPAVVTPEEVSEADVEVERALAIKQATAAGKPEEIAKKMVEGKLKKFREERALLTQAYIKDPSKTVQQLLHAAVQELGENISVKSFSKLSV